MKVANPIYDVVFKYLLEDNKIAKLLISNLLGVKINHLELRPQEYSSDFSKQIITVYRVDFKAEIVLSSGKTMVVLIEIQKAKFTTDIMRFRRYLGEQYASKQNIIKTADKTKPLPIISIYFLGYGLKNNPDTPIIRVKRKYLDNYNNQELKGEEEFIECLTHDSIIVQIPALKNKHRNDLEKALTVFEQGKIQEVSINPDDYPKKYQKIIRRLLKAIGDEQIRNTMNVEDEIIEDLERKERLIAKQQKFIEDKNQTIERKNQELEKEKQKAEKEKEKIIKTVKKMEEKGLTVSQISDFTDLSKNEIEKILNKYN